MSPKRENFDALDPETVAELLGVGVRMVRIYCKDKGLPFHGDARGRTFRWSEVREWWVDYQIALRGNSGNAPAMASAPRPVLVLPAPQEDLGPPEVAPETFKEALTRKTRADADLKELELAVKRGQVVAIADVQKLLESLFVNVKQKIMAIPSKFGARLDGVRDRNQRKAILDAECRQICQELSTISISGQKVVSPDPVQP